MQGSKPGQLQVYRQIIENLDWLKHQEGTTQSELDTLKVIQENLAGLAGDPRLSQMLEAKGSGSFGFNLTFEPEIAAVLFGRA
jgi:hypothetical protein